ncbi:glycosyltransferase family 2 protein [Vibrio cholerae]|nr:glycosyltransferase family 2 protein [Vibrio cholerae]EGR1049232.1 glycosyltransferase family 2 protein [Vibrio cholerae]EGR4347944.1 glycosyltransferase family 2 protein [Vibrio cholerae]
MNSLIEVNDTYQWQVPKMQTKFWSEKNRKYCIVIPVINEGERIISLLKRMKELNTSYIADIIIIDGGSTDGSLEIQTLKDLEVSGLLVKTDTGKLSAQLRCAYAFALKEGYEGIVTIDGNNKDDPITIAKFIQELDSGIDFVQASRFIPGGISENTPFIRFFAIKFIHAPILSIISGFRWTDTTQGFRAYSRRLLMDIRVSIFRDVFSGYELLAYLNYRAPKLGFSCKEIASSRKYPIDEVPTKINGVKGYFSLMITLVKVCSGKLNP